MCDLSARLNEALSASATASIRRHISVRYLFADRTRRWLVRHQSNFAVLRHTVIYFKFQRPSFGIKSALDIFWCVKTDSMIAALSLPIKNLQEHKSYSIAFIIVKDGRLLYPGVYCANLNISIISSYGELLPSICHKCVLFVHLYISLFKFKLFRAEIISCQ